MTDCSWATGDNRLVIKVLAREHPNDAFATIDRNDLARSDNYDLIWVDVESAELAELNSVLSVLGFDTTSTAPIEREYFHVVDERDHSIRMTLSVPEIVSGRLTIDQIHVVIGDSVLVTNHDDDVPGIDRLFTTEALSVPDIVGSASLAAALSQSAGRELIPLIDELEVRIDALEDLALASDPRTLTEGHALRRDLITLRRISGRQRDILEDLSESAHQAIGDDGRLAFARSAEYVRRIVETLDSARGLLGSALDTYRGAVADQTNEIVRLLTVFSAILLPLTLIAGVFGMNFLEIPTSTESWGFWASVGGMAVIAIALWLYFAKRGFVGGPKLRDVPKAVGLGIVQVGTAPVRAIASGVESTIQYLDPRRQDGRSGD